MHRRIKPFDTAYFSTKIQELYYIYICTTSSAPFLRYYYILITNSFRNIWWKSEYFIVIPFLSIRSTVECYTLSSAKDYDQHFLANRALQITYLSPSLAWSVRYRLQGDADRADEILEEYKNHLKQIKWLEGKNKDWAKTKTGQKVLKSKKLIISGLEKPWYYTFDCGQIDFTFSWNWSFA